MIREKDLLEWIEDMKKELVVRTWTSIRHGSETDKLPYFSGQAFILEELKAEIPDLTKKAQDS